MEYIVAIIAIFVALLGYEKIKVNRINALLNNTKNKDTKLKASKKEVEKQIEDIDNSISKITEERQQKKDKVLSDEERADEWNR